MTDSLHSLQTAVSSLERYERAHPHVLHDANYGPARINLLTALCELEFERRAMARMLRNAEGRQSGNKAFLDGTSQEFAESVLHGKDVPVPGYAAQLEPGEGKP